MQEIENYMLYQMGALYGGKLPCTPAIVPGGCTEVVTGANQATFTGLLNQVRSFINGPYQADVRALAEAFAEYTEIGRGCGNFLAYGVFDLFNTDGFPGAVQFDSYKIYAPG